MDYTEVIGYPGYKINSNGDIWSNKLKRRLDPPTDKDGYQRIGLWKNQVQRKYRVHRLVALNFIPNPENKPTVNHIDGDILNNNVSNLEWATVAEQNHHKINTLGHKTPKGIHSKPITLVRDGIDYSFSTTREAYTFLGIGGQQARILQSGGIVKEYKIKNIYIV